MKKNRDCVVCGTNMQLFKNGDPANMKKKEILDETFHVITMNWQDFLKLRPTWFMNHPTLCFRRSAVLAVGNYVDRGKDFLLEDYELELKLMHKFGSIYNLGDTLLYYRIHSGQITYNKNSDSPEYEKQRKQIIDEILNPPQAQQEDFYDDW
jgi:hypothetical protein